MKGSTSWQDFCSLYYDQAISNAKYYLTKIKSGFAHWDERINEDVIVIDAALEALQKAFVKYNPSRGASLTTYLSRIIHNELVDELAKEMKSISSLNELTAHQEAEYSIHDMVPHIPDAAMDDLKERLRAAILKLSPIDQCIIGFYMDNPHTFIEKSVETLNVTPNFVSVHKNRALAKLPALMGVSSSDYYDLYEEHQYAGHKAQKTGINLLAYINPVCKQFDLDATVVKLFDAISEVVRFHNISVYNE